ncbi:MAG: hypothetical protein PPP58_02580 [Natronomonas sp.]
MTTDGHGEGEGVRSDRGTRRRTSSGRADTERVQTALSRLANDDERTVRRAAAAVDDLEAAATFVEETGVSELAAAIEAIERKESETVPKRGREALDLFRQFRQAARSKGVESVGEETTAQSDAVSSGVRDGTGEDDQFHSGRGTDLSDGTEGIER